jgi:16S rRNA (cytidine1402-2'-O)-methyltransferase
MGKLSVIATPIGNMEDITLRALRVLKEADYVLCEDTRVTGNLLKHHGISTKLKRYDAHTNERVHEEIIRDLEGNKNIALVSDAGTPGVSDPGVLLVARARFAGARIEAIPGPSALTAAYSIAGIGGNKFVFLGFVPQKKGRQTFFKSLAKYDMPVIFYEAPHRIMKTLGSLIEVFPPQKDRHDRTSDRTIVVARELTKMFEEVVAGTPQEVFRYFTDHSEHVRGEFVVIIK